MSPFKKEGSDEKYIEETLITAGDDVNQVSPNPTLVPLAGRLTFVSQTPRSEALSVAVCEVCICARTDVACVSLCVGVGVGAWLPEKL